MGKPTVLTSIAAIYCLKIDVQWKGKSEPETIVFAGKIFLGILQPLNRL